MAIPALHCPALHSFMSTCHSLEKNLWQAPAHGHNGLRQNGHSLEYRQRVGERDVLKSDIAIYSALLVNKGWLRHTPADFAERFIAHCHWRSFAAGAGIQHAGEEGGIAAGIAHGSAVLTTSLSTPDSPMLHILHPGDWFGYIPLFLPGARPNSVVARTDVTIAVMSQSEIEAFLAPQPQWWRYIGTLAAVHANMATAIAADMMIRDSNRRCAAALLNLANCRRGDPSSRPVLNAPLSQEELAAIANLSRTSVSTILRDLEEKGLIELGYRTVTLLDPARLRALVDNV
jgi:CRP-like cAMP-binding protein